MSDHPGSKSYNDTVADLRALANRWVLMARDHARESKTRTGEGEEAKAAYYRGLAEAYHKLAMELADVVKAMPATGPAAASARADSVGGEVAPPGQPDASATPAMTYASVPLGEALRMLDYAGISARDVKQHKDYVFTAVFSRWQPFSETERLDRIKSVDPRVVILNFGKLPDTQDPYVDFAFQER